jgi:hypothetical protein
LALFVEFAQGYVENVVSQFPSLSQHKIANCGEGRCCGQFSLGFRGFCRRHANLRDSTNRQIASPKPFRLFFDRTRAFWVRMEIIESFQALKNLADRTFRSASLGYQDVQKPEVDVAERSNAKRMWMWRNVPMAAGRTRFILRHMTFVWTLEPCLP